MENTMPFQKNDGGWKDSGIKDHNNCCVIGFATAAGIPYMVADEIAVKTKRKRRKGHWPHKMVAYAKRKHEIRFHKLKFKTITLQKFLEKYKEGRYYISTRKHAYAIINGVIHDHDHKLHKPRQIITKAYKLVS